MSLSSSPRAYLGVALVKGFLLPCGVADAVRRVAAGMKVSSTGGVPTGL